jgi:hypothetical protein
MLSPDCAVTVRVHNIIGKIILKFTQNPAMAYTPCWALWPKVLLSLDFVVDQKV